MLNTIAATVLTVSMGLSPQAGLATATPSSNSWLTHHPTIGRMLELQNQERARYGLAPWKLNENLCVAAQKHAEWMAETGYYVHSNMRWPEIIHAGPRTPEHAVQDWIWSPSHHAVMLSGRVAGCGYAVRNGVAYWVTLVDSDPNASTIEYSPSRAQTQNSGQTQTVTQTAVQSYGQAQPYVQTQNYGTYYYQPARTARAAGGRGFRRGRLSRAR